jgi:hypothetical protein
MHKMWGSGFVSASYALEFLAKGLLAPLHSKASFVFHSLPPPRGKKPPHKRAVRRLLTAPIEGAPFHHAHSGSSEEHPAVALFLSFSTSLSIQSGRYPDKRVTGLPFTARVQRGPSEAARCASKKGNRLLATFSSAHPSNPSPPSPSAAPRR